MKNGRYQIKDMPRIDLLSAIADHACERFKGEPWTRRHGLGRFPPKLLYAWLETSQGAAWVEYGTSARCCWLTPEGELWLTVLILVQRIYARHAAGCCLHIVLDDGNCGDESVGFCIGQATLQGHADCLQLAHMLRMMSSEQRWALSRDRSATRSALRTPRQPEGNARTWKKSGRPRRA